MTKLEYKWPQYKWHQNVEHFSLYPIDTMIQDRIQILEHLLNQNPESIIIYGALFRLYSKRREYDKRIQLANQFSNIRSLDIKAWYSLQNQSLNEGLKSLKKAADRGGNSALFAMAMYCFAIQESEAYEPYKHYLKQAFEAYEHYLKQAIDQGHSLAILHNKIQNSKTNAEKYNFKKLERDIVNSSSYRFTGDDLLSLYKRLLNPSKVDLKWCM